MGRVLIRLSLPRNSLAQARTGTGKTLAFLIPSIENLLRAPTQPPRGQISVLVLSPTRELAIQIEDSAKVLLSGTSYKVQHVVGGTNMNAETKRLNTERCGESLSFAWPSARFSR